MRLGNPAVASVSGEGLSGGLVNYVLSRIDRAEHERDVAQNTVAAYKQAVAEFKAFGNLDDADAIEGRARELLSANG